jgi:prepilin-type processing-associated H-X9-DG protein
MALKHRRTWLTTLTLLAIAAGVTWSFAQPGEQGEAPDPITLLPQHSLLFFSTDGHDEHASAWEQTAAHQAVDQSGLSALVDKTLDSVQVLADSQGAGPVAELLRGLISHVRNRGVSLAMTVVPPQGGPPLGYAVLVLHDGARFEEALSELVRAAADGELNFDTIDQAGRNVTFALIPDSPGVEIGWWQERGHLVVVAGIQAVNSALTVMTGDAPNATASPLYENYVAAERDFEAVTTGWLDMASIRQLVSGIPLPMETGPEAPGPLTVGEVLKMVGLSNLNSVVSVSGYKGPALWSETWVDAPGKRTGLLGMAEGAPLTLDDLPPMPFALNSFTATRFNLAKLYDEVLTAAYQLARFAPNEDAAAQIDGALNQAKEALGLDVRQDLLAHLGTVLCGYDDSQQGLLNMGAGFVVELKNPAAFKDGFDQLLVALGNLSEGAILTRRVEKQGREVVLLEFHPSPYSQAFCIDGNWLVIGSPQVVEAYLLRVDGNLPRWEPSPEHQAALDAMPGEFSSIAVSDPRGFINLISGLAPLAIDIAEMGMRESGEFPPDFEFPIHADDFPPAALISQPLFPNVAMVEVTADGIHSRSRTSLPAIPLVGSGDAVTTTAVVAVGVALLLPAVQQAREAARRTQSQNNIRQLTIGMHNYESAHRHFPSGTILNAELEPEQRLSWIVELLPYIEQNALYEGIDRSAAWNSEDNLQFVSNVIETLVNPGVAEGPTVFDADFNQVGATHYVGIGGLGEEGPTLGVKDPKAGVFGYDRRTRIADIVDGTSNTFMIGEASGNFDGDYGSWAQGGRATVLPFTQQPYINGPDGIGGPYNGGANFGLADGSVRFVSDEINPSIVEALTTIAGGEVVQDF